MGKYRKRIHKIRRYREYRDTGGTAYTGYTGDTGDTEDTGDTWHIKRGISDTENITILVKCKRKIYQFYVCRFILWKRNWKKRTDFLSLLKC